MNKELGGEGVSYVIRATTPLIHEMTMRDTATTMEVVEDKYEESMYYINLPGEDANLQLWLGTEERAKEFIEEIESHLE